MNMINVTFRGISCDVVIIDDKSTAADLDGSYLIELIHQDGNIVPTGRAMDGNGSPITFNIDEIIIKKVEA